MKYRKQIAMAGIMALTVSMAAGCGQASSETTAAGSSEVSESQVNNLQNITVKVSSIDGNKITAESGTLSVSEPQGMPNGGGQGQENPPEMPSGNVPENGSAPEMSESGAGQAQENPPEMPSGNAPENGSAPEMSESGAGQAQGNPPEMPSGESMSGAGSAPEMPDGGGILNGMGGSEFVSDGTQITFTVTDQTEITVEFLQGSGEGSMDNIAEGAVLEVVLNADKEAESIIVKNLQAGQGFGGSGEVTNGTAAETITEDTSQPVVGQTYTSTGDDENALRIDGAKAVLNQITVNKTAGASSNTENGDFYGQNAGLLALNGAEVTIQGAEVNTSVTNGNGVFSYGEGTEVNISDSVIRTTGNNSGGIQTTGGGAMNAQNLDVETKGNSAAAIRSDRGGGTVNVEGGTYTTYGTGSPAVYSTADITVSDAVLTANASEGVVVEGKNRVTLNSCDLSGSMTGTYQGDSSENMHGVMIYQSMSGDADMGEASFTAVGGSIKTTVGDLFYVTNTDCQINLENVELGLADDTLLRIEGNDSSRGWGTQGANGGDVIMTAKDQALTGNILVDEISSLKLNMSGSTVFDGAVNPDGQAGTVDVTMEEGTVWNLTGDSYITSFNGDLSQINTGSYHLYVNGEQVK